MRKLALSVAVALSSFLSKPALAVEFKELYLICNTNKKLVISGKQTERNRVIYIFIENDIAEVNYNFFKTEEYLYKKKFLMLKKIELQAMKPMLRIEDFVVHLFSTAHSPQFLLSRIDLIIDEAGVSNSERLVGGCQVSDKTVFRKKRSLTREFHEKEFDSIIQKLNAESKKEYREYQEKLSKRKF
jgi:hypothetical protein